MNERNQTVGPGRPVGAGAVSEFREVSLLQIMTMLLRSRWLILGCAALAVLGYVAVDLLRPDRYTSESSFLPQSRRQTMPAAVSGLAAQLGILQSGSETGQSPFFYADLVRSREILGAVAGTEFEMGRDGAPRRGTVAALYDIGGDNDAIRHERVVDRLRRDIRSHVQRTNVVEVAVAAPDAQLAMAINRRILDLVNEFNMRSRREAAAAERQFTEARLEEIRRDLRAAEDRMAGFLQRNRAIDGSPQLTFERERLGREIALQQQLYATVAESHEQAKMEETRTTPVITIVESPDTPAQADRRVTPIGLLALALIGALFGVLLAAWRHALTGATSPEEYGQFEAARAQAMRELTWPLRRLSGRRLPAGRSNGG